MRQQLIENRKLIRQQKTLEKQEQKRKEKEGKVRKSRKVELCPEDLTTLINAYNSGEGAAKIGKQFNIHESTVYRILHDNNIHIRTNSEANKITAKKLKRSGKEASGWLEIPEEIKIKIHMLYEQKHTQAQISELVGFSVYKIRQTLQTLTNK